MSTLRIVSFQSGIQLSAVVHNEVARVIFEDEFDTLDLDTWQHEITGGGGGNFEFQYYTNNRSNSYVRDGILYIKPTLTEDKYDENFVKYGTLGLDGSYPANTCTGRQWNGCTRSGNYDGGYIVNPIQSARIRTVNAFSFTYGKVEIEAQMPSGDWIWPAIWLLPERNVYGDWPASGEIDIVECRGNLDLKNADGASIGANNLGSTLHWGPFWPWNAWYLTHGEKFIPPASPHSDIRKMCGGESIRTLIKKGGASEICNHNLRIITVNQTYCRLIRTLSDTTFADGFHKFTLEWRSSGLKFFVDDEMILDVAPPSGKTMYEWAGFEEITRGAENPWVSGSALAPFDQNFYLVLNVAVGGTTGYFPDDVTNGSGPKPWNNTSPTAMKDFWDRKGEWYPTWKGEDAAMKIKYVKVTKL